MGMCYAIIQKDPAGCFTWLREGEPQFAKHATLVKVLEGKDYVTVGKAASEFLATLCHESVSKNS